jgi:hypothetical protein
MTAPSYSTPPSPRTVIGENAFQIMLSQMLTAMNKEIPDPRPYPFYNISSSIKIMIDAKTNWRIIKIAFPAPI